MRAKKKNEIGTSLPQVSYETYQSLPALHLDYAGSQTRFRRGSFALSSTRIRKLFENESEAYQKWNQSLPGYVPPHIGIGTTFVDTKSLREAYDRLKSMRETFRWEMIAFQEEMDWLLYSAYDFLPDDHATVQAEVEPTALNREERPFYLYAEAQGDFARAVTSIPNKWSSARKNLWEVRLAAIRDNEHIRRIEQPVYKRRWDEQWKVGNEWRCGPIGIDEDQRFRSRHSQNY